MIFAEGSEFIRCKELVVYFAFHERGNVRQFGLDLAVLDSNLRLALEAREGIWVVKHLGADIRKQPLPSRRAAVTTGEARADEEKRITPGIINSFVDYRFDSLVHNLSSCTNRHAREMLSHQLRRVRAESIVAVLPVDQSARETQRHNCSVLDLHAKHVVEVHPLAPTIPLVTNGGQPVG